MVLRSRLLRDPAGVGPDRTGTNIACTDEIEREVIRAEGLDWDDPAAMAASLPDELRREWTSFGC
jgi:hypothetical protein